MAWIFGVTLIDRARKLSQNSQMYTVNRCIFEKYVAFHKTRVTFSFRESKGDNSNEMQMTLKMQVCLTPDIYLIDRWLSIFQCEIIFSRPFVRKRAIIIKINKNNFLLFYHSSHFLWVKLLVAIGGLFCQSSAYSAIFEVFIKRTALLKFEKGGIPSDD